MRLKRFVDFGLLEIGQKIWLIPGQPEYEIHVRIDPIMPPDNNVVLEVLFKGLLFTSNNLQILIKRFQSNGFKIPMFCGIYTYFYVDEKRTKTLETLKRIITNIVMQEYNIKEIGKSVDGWFVCMPEWNDELEHIRCEIKSILGINVKVFILRPNA